MSTPLDVLTGFARALRAEGVAADRTRLTTSVAALSCVDPTDREQLYWTTRLTLCSEPDDLPRFDALFESWFGPHRPNLPAPALPRPAVQLAAVRGLALQADVPAEQGDDEQLRTAAADTEVLRAHDIATLSDEERAEVNRMIALLAPRVGRRRSLRMARGGRERVDVPRTVRQMLADGGEPGALRFQKRRERPRRLVLLLDVSGSMAPYADVLLRFAHAAVRVSPAGTEVFTAGTRLTRVTRQLRLRDPELALRAAGAAVPDWSGGTRLGEALRAFLDRWGQRGTARGAVVVIASDGWERGDAQLLGEQMARLTRLAHRIVWINPHKGKSGFAPLTGGMMAAQPHIDDLVAGHSFDALANVAEVIGHA
jgi:uncharacterized protein with von Willebrand factor type A (vWA) domain